MRTPPPSRRRPRRLDGVAYRVRIDLKGTKPPLWRRLQVTSDLFLDDFHDVNPGSVRLDRQPSASIRVWKPSYATRSPHLIRDAALDQPVQADTETAARMVRPYAWLLGRVGTDGITLTGAGYLPPVHVDAAVTELHLTTEWIGKGNRESQTLPVLDLRESAQKAGLLRKHGGKVLLTAQGRAMRRDRSRCGGCSRRRHRHGPPMPARGKPDSSSWSRPPPRSRTTWMRPSPISSVRSAG